MKYKLLFVILLFKGTICLAQSQLAQKGIITLVDNQKLVFNNVRLQDGKFVFFDVKSGSEKNLAISEVKYIEDEKESKVFTNKSVVDRTREADLKLEAEQKKLAIENATKEEAAYRKKLEDKKKALAMNLYPPGVYTTKEDFLKMTPNKSEDIVPKEVIGLEKEEIYGTPDECLFYFVQSDKKIKNAFAVSFRGNLYFQISAILNNRNKTDRAQSNDHPNEFIKVKIYGDNYYYCEADLTNFWAEGLSYGAVGGAIGL